MMKQKEAALEFAKLASDWEWRLNNLYYITDKEGRVIKFQMNTAQRELFKNMHLRNIILKARQLGFTTFIMIFMLDACLFRKNTRCGVIAHNQDDAKRLFREKAKFAYDLLPDFLKQMVGAKVDRAGELVFSNGSSLTVGTSFRGGTFRYLHISEFAKICCKYPDRAQEIVTGAFEAVSKDNVIFIESTAEGRTGYFYQYCMDSLNKHRAGMKLTALDWKFHFFPWHMDKAYTLDDPIIVPQRVHDYFEDLALKVGSNFTSTQRRWYAKKEETLGEKIKQEYPSTPEEAFEQSIEGTFYQRQFEDLYRHRRITKVPHSPASCVHTIWDLGVNDSTAIWFVQLVGAQWQVIDYYENEGEGLAFYKDVLDKKKIDLGYTYGTHLGPHDLEVREFSTGKTRKEMAQGLGLFFEVAPKLPVMDGIEAVRGLLPSVMFDQERTADGVAKLQQYRKDWDDKHGVWKDRPCHDHTSHAADSFRYFAICAEWLRDGYSSVVTLPATHQQQIPTGAWT
ncbi:terminase [Ferrimonas balearica]|uniref:terminase n=1 Tax=Ferrimonas balearica TaxID=44012 RepID=UPI001C976C84|nr:terminase [Ferrimonas balearica]MBY6105015.1 terminase [Ferrimonas balearica]